MTILSIIYLLVTISSGIIGLVSIKKEKKLLGIILLSLAVIGGILGAVIYSKTNEDLENIRKYSYVATLNATGAAINPKGALTISNPLYNLLKETYELEETYEGVVHNHQRFLCSSATYDIFKEAIELNPEFPFSYAALATCKVSRNEGGWLEYAKKARDILEITTTINGHKKAHDQMLEVINELFD